MKTMFQVAAAAVLVLSLGTVAEAQSHDTTHVQAHHSGAVQPSSSHTVMGLSVPR